MRLRNFFCIASGYSALQKPALALAARISAQLFALAVWANVSMATFPAKGADAGLVDGNAFFESKVRPLFVARCHSCHGPEKQESGLRLDQRSEFFKGGVSGEIVKQPGVGGEPLKLDDHLLWQMVSRSGSVAMPPEDPLSAEELSTLQHWLEMGAPWPDDGQAKPVPTEDLLQKARRELWSMQPIRRSPLPEGLVNWANNRSDVWIAEGLRKAGLAPSPQAEKSVLARRLSIDLLGLPASYEEIKSFEKDDRPDALVRKVDRMLASPRYGERWGRHWLDVARFADTRGYEFEGRDRRYPYSFTYREYVYSAFNRDLPYNQFLLEQLAADLLPESRGPSALAALGFLTIGRRYIHPDDTLDDRIDVVSRGLMGLTVTCARCHDHKFDPIPTRDYYSLYGVFASCEEPAQLPQIGESMPGPAYDAFKARHAEKQQVYERFRSEKHQELRAQFLQQIAEYLLASVAEETTETGVALASCLSFSKEELRPGYIDSWKRFLENKGNVDEVWGVWKQAVAAAKEAEGRIDQNEAFRNVVATGVLEEGKAADASLIQLLRERSPGKLEDVAGLYRDWIIQRKNLWDADESKKREAIDANDRLAAILYVRRSPLNLDDDQLDRNLQRDVRNKLDNLRRDIDIVETESDAAPPRAMVLQDKRTPFEPVVYIRGNPQRHGDRVPRQMPQMAAVGERKPFAQGSGRLELAQAIVDPANTFTSRVMANRLWQHHFGVGFTSGPLEMGLRGDPPSHPELLDHLARTLIDEGWSVKRVHREIVFSAAYQQSSTQRPEAALVDPDNRWLWKQNGRRLELEPLRDSLLWASGQLDLRYGGRAEQLWKQPYSKRRAAYGFVDRQDLPNAFRAFDFASPDVSTSSRPRTTTPQQSLLLMNSELAIEQAQELSRRAAEMAHEDQQVSFLFRSALARDPSEAELAGSLDFLRQEAESRPQFGAADRLRLLAHALLMTNEFAFVD